MQVSNQTNTIGTHLMDLNDIQTHQRRRNSKMPNNEVRSPDSQVTAGIDPAIEAGANVSAGRGRPS